MFNPEQEQELTDYCKDMCSRFYGLSFKDLQAMAFEYADSNGIPNPFDKSSRLAGRDWVSGFLKRNSTLSLKTPEAISLGRAIGFNEPQWNIYQDNLQALYEKHHFPPGRIYNMDESGLSTVPNKLRKVIGEKGHNASKIVSAERGITVTVVCCMSAAGNFVPPTLIYPRKRHNEVLLHGAPPGSIQMCSDSGFINSDLYLDWLKHFQLSVKSSLEDPVLLILDNHSSHISLQAVQYCREHAIHVASLPPHSSHKTQPLDVCFYGPLKIHYAAAAENWMATHPGRAISQYQVAELLNSAYSRTASVGVAAKAFSAAGIWPLNRNAFTAADFVGSLLTDRPEPSTCAASDVGTGPTVDSVSDVSGETEVTAPSDNQAATSAGMTSSDAELNRPKAPTNVLPSMDVAPNDSNAAADTDRPMPTGGPSVDTSQAPTTPISAHLSTAPGPSAPTNRVTPSQIRPLPRSAYSSDKKRKRSMRSEIITASPFKNKLEEKEHENVAKKLKLESRKKIQSEKRAEKCKKKLNFKKKKPEKKRTCRDSRRKKKLPLNNCRPAKKTASSRKMLVNSGPGTSSEAHQASDVHCPACDEAYIDPPTEDWIQCNHCRRWWHENCSAYEGGVFQCDLCGSQN